MPPNQRSRYRSPGLVLNDDGTLVTDDREPFRFRDRIDNILHRVETGDTLESLAHRFYGNAGGALLYWIIADFQPEPIIDPTEALVVGSLLVLPSTTFVESTVLGITDRVQSTIA